MHSALSILVAFSLAQAPAEPVPPIETKIIQAHPAPMVADQWTRTKPRAVMLIHGIKPHVWSKEKIAQPLYHDWQLPGSAMAQALGKDGDVYSFAWGQNGGLNAVVNHSALPQAIKKLKFMGYDEVVLIGHSAGGLIARMLVEDQPELGVTKVIQVCSPNGGAPLAEVAFAVRRDQESLLRSLTTAERRKCLESRCGCAIPEKTQFLCVVGCASLGTDGLVPITSQWTEDLQKQGIPAVRLSTTHWTAMRSAKSAEKLAEWVNANHPRWDAEQVKAAKKVVLGD
jgi:pimeloyl-ACP methyl ester carboxylesterase